MVTSRTIGRFAVVIAGGLLFAAVGVLLFVILPTTITDLFGILFAIIVALFGVKIAGNIAASLFPEYNVAEVAVDGPIVREQMGAFPRSPRGTAADDVVEQVERANDDGNVDALLVKLNTPGGEILPSDDVKLAVEDFDGPTVAYATDRCASGGYWIASGCDELWAREASLVGSIGVIGSRINATEFAEKIGLSYEGFTAGEYKDAGVPFKEIDDDDRDYLQGLIDDFYDHFVERVSDGRNLDPGKIRDTEAKVYLGAAAAERGLVDEIGTRDDVESALADRLDVDSVTVKSFEPAVPWMARIGSTVQNAAYAFGLGVAGVADERDLRVRL